MALENVVLVRYSEIAVKGASTRARMESMLAANIQEAIERGGGKGLVEVLEGRLLLRNPEPDALEVARLASRVFGVKSTSPAYEVEFASLEDLVGKAGEFFADRVKGRVFRVRARRVGKHEFTSKDVERALGKHLLDLGAKSVDLDNPEYTAYVEVRGRKAYFYDTIIEGPGGLPLGSEGRVLVLFSGGFDSTASAWLAMKRGAAVELAFYDIAGNLRVIETAIEAAKALDDLWAHGYPVRMAIIDFRRIAVEVGARVRPEYRTLVLRRAMALHATRLASKLGVNAVVTGESIGQVASQTLVNLELIWGGIGFPVIRPVACMDKDEVVSLVRRIGLYDIVSRQVEVCGRDATPTPRGSRRVFEEEYSKVSSLLEEWEPPLVEFTLRDLSPRDALALYMDERR